MGTPDNWQQTTPDDRGDARIEPLPPGKATRRLTIMQLENSIPRLFGGDTWTFTNQQGQTFQLFEALGPTLGEADYVRTTSHNVEPTALFSKFMDDMASDLCAKAIARDATNPPVAERLVVRYPENVDQNLRFMLLKFHNVYVPPESTADLEELRRLYEVVVADAAHSESDGWFAVCVALVTSPEFMAY